MKLLPGFRGQRCPRCKQPIVWARTMAGPRGRGGKAMPLDAAISPDGTVATRWNGHTTYARVLGKDDELDEVAEQRAMVHFATCKPPLPIPEENQPEPGTRRRHLRVVR